MTIEGLMVMFILFNFQNEINSIIVNNINIIHVTVHISQAVQHKGITS